MFLSPKIVLVLANSVDHDAAAFYSSSLFAKVLI